MSATLQISFRNMEPVASAEVQVRARVAELAQFSDRLGACRVVLDAAHRRPRHGRTYDVHIELSVPNGPIVVSRNPGEGHAHEDLSVAIRDAFDAARRRLQDHMRRMEGATKVHEPG
jgi:ribosome-associated translation inhibitor RaiA